MVRNASGGQQADADDHAGSLLWRGITYALHSAGALYAIGALRDLHRAWRIQNAPVVTDLAALDDDIRAHGRSSAFAYRRPRCHRLTRRRRACANSWHDSQVQATTRSWKCPRRMISYLAQPGADRVAPLDGARGDPVARHDGQVRVVLRRPAGNVPVARRARRPVLPGVAVPRPERIRSAAVDQQPPVGQHAQVLLLRPAQHGTGRVPVGSPASLTGGRVQVSEKTDAVRPFAASFVSSLLGIRLPFENIERVSVLPVDCDALVVAHVTHDSVSSRLRIAVPPWSGKRHVLSCPSESQQGRCCCCSGGRSILRRSPR